MSKDEGTNFMSNTTFLAAGVPAGVKYNPKKEFVQRRSLSTKIYPAKPKAGPPKTKVGPGHYEDDVANMKLKTTERR